MREEFQQLIESFCQAWTLVKAHLASFGMYGSESEIITSERNIALCKYSYLYQF